MLKQTLNLSWIIILVFQMCIFANAQTATPTPNPLQAEVDEAEARAKIAKARKEELEAKFPTPDADALKGSTDVKGELIESRLQAYKAMEAISNKIASDAQMNGVRGLYIYSEEDFAKIVSYKRLIQRLDVINDQYDQIYPPPAIVIAAVPPGVVAKLLLDWLPLLKTETKITGSEFDIADEAVWASLGNSLSALKPTAITLNNPFASSFDFIDLNGISTLDLVKKLQYAQDDFDKIKVPCPAPAMPPNAADIACQAKLTRTSQVDGAFTKLKEDIGLKATALMPETKKTITKTTTTPTTVTVEETIEKTSATSESQNSLTFWDYLKIGKIIQTMQLGSNIYWIKIKNVKAGGNVRVKSNPLIDIFRGGSSIKFSGGSVAYYYILDNDGKIKLSGVVYGYEPYTKSSQIK